MSDENNYENPNENDVIDASCEVSDVVVETTPYNKRAILWVIGSAASMVVAVIMIVVTASMFYNNGQLENAFSTWNLNKKH